MTRQTGRGRRICLVLALLIAPTWLLAGQLEDAERCTRESGRLERLACFDRVFGTPLTSQAEPSSALASQSERWRQAFAQAGGDSGASVTYRDTGVAAGHLVTIAALGVQPPRPLLTLQCHNNITELSLMLPRPISEERIRLALVEELSPWRVRDGGFVISSGRGLPAIGLAKSLLARDTVRTRAGHPDLDGLLFDLSGLAEAVRPLRQACGW